MGAAVIMGRSRSTPGSGRRRRRIRRLRRWAWRWRLAFTRKPPGCERLRVVSYLDCSQNPGGFRAFRSRTAWGYACFWTRPPTRWTAFGLPFATAHFGSGSRARPSSAHAHPYELSCEGGSRDQARRWSSDRFHGNHASGFSGGWPPASARAVKYAVSQVRGVIPHNANVWDSEKSIAASRPLQTAPEP